MKSLRTQLLWSHLALVGLMALVMTVAVVNFFRLGLSIDRILEANYKSVIAAQTMKEALERQDSAATFLLAGQKAKARRQYRENVTRFQKAFEIEANNITEDGEKHISDDIARRFKIYRADSESLINGAPLSDSQAREFYFGTLEPQFDKLKKRAQDVLDLNQAAIVRADQRAKADAQRASWIGIGMTLGALLLAVIFAQRAINASLTPLLVLARGAEEIGAGHLDRRIEIERADEIGTLAASFNEMAQKLGAAHVASQQQLQRAEKMSDAALESLYDPVIVTDATGKVVHLNRAAQGLFGPANEASGQSIAQLVNEPRIAEAVENAARQERISAAEDEASFVVVQDSTYRLRATPMRDDDGALLGAALVLEDITHLNELSRLKTEFIGVASHELRTPVTSLLLSAQLLEEGAAGALNEDQAEIVAAQREDLARLDDLLRDLLDITKLESGAAPQQFQSVAPRDLVAAARNSVGAPAAAKGLDLLSEIAPDLPNVRADNAQITRVLVNLLNNAIRHTPSGGTVTIAARQTADKVRFEVSDTGEGIPPDQLARIFERFVQVPGATRGGAGLGLSIAQTIIRAHGGEIVVRSTPGVGSCFEFELQIHSPKKESNGTNFNY